MSCSLYFCPRAHNLIRMVVRPASRIASCTAGTVQGCPGGPHRATGTRVRAAFISHAARRLQWGPPRRPGVRTYQSAGVDSQTRSYSPSANRPLYNSPVVDINSLCVSRSHWYPRARSSSHASLRSSTTNARGGLWVTVGLPLACAFPRTAVGSAV